MRLRLLQTLIAACVLAVLLAWMALSGAPVALGNACPASPDRSPGGPADATSITFENQSSRPLDINWLDYDGNRQYYMTLPSGQSYTQATYVGHVWIAVDSNNVCRGKVTASSSHTTYTIVDDATPTPTPTPTPTATTQPTTSPTPQPTAGSTPTPTTGPQATATDADRDGIGDGADRCPTSGRGAFDRDSDGCPGPYARIAARLAGNWVVDEPGVRLVLPELKDVPVGATLRVTCRPCRVGQTLTATKPRVPLKKLRNKLLERGESFSFRITKPGSIGQLSTYTIKRYGHTRAAYRRAARRPWLKVSRCIPVGSTRSAAKCSATPPTGP